MNPMKRLIVDIEYFNLQRSTRCRKDYVRLIGLSGKLCGYVSSHAVVTRGSSFMVHFKSDRSRAAKGFKLHVVAATELM